MLQVEQDVWKLIFHKAFHKALKMQSNNLKLIILGPIHTPSACEANIYVSI